ncbi:hypothetical protein P167DRAFT_102153 [Morchella conica CCBAS932]|uniref:Transmembrane protein n=1 Tax=Morchella conica CCBAS932 TaxID=1392247 RepID=A0A3N4L675_9PEZI|nr:hypothetical protein P167DRAFT_102153 [Morchella conica CCBAS932]
MPLVSSSSIHPIHSFMGLGAHTGIGIADVSFQKIEGRCAVVWLCCLVGCVVVVVGGSRLFVRCASDRMRDVSEAN